MKISYIISAYKLPELLIRLVNRLNTTDSSFYIHIDKKTNETQYQLVFNSLQTLNNVHFLDRHVCQWGDFGHVKATLKGIAQIIQQESEFDYCILLTGQDYPIKSNRYIQDFLSSNPIKSYINYFPSSHPWVKGWEDRIQYWYIKFMKYQIIFPKALDLNNRLLRNFWNLIVNNISVRRKLPYGLIPFFGSSYWTLNAESIYYIYEFCKSHPRYIPFFKNVPIPDEIFFQTILANSQLEDTLINDDLVRTDFSAHRPHPAILTINDYDKLAESPNLFARKFDPTVDADILDMIDTRLLIDN